jgi:hypothetical protein
MHARTMTRARVAAVVLAHALCGVTVQGIILVEMRHSDQGMRLVSLAMMCRLARRLRHGLNYTAQQQPRYEH